MLVDVTHQPEYARASFSPVCGSPDDGRCGRRRHPLARLSPRRGRPRDRCRPSGVVGPQFNDLHNFFQAPYTALTEVADDVAERIWNDLRVCC